MDNKALTAEERIKVSEWITAHCNQPLVCYACGKDVFSIQQTLSITPLYGGNSIMLGPGYPAVVVICSNCGNMIFLNAVVIGIVKAEGSADA